MKTCRYEGLIDDYLLNKMEPSDRLEFENHYFNCPSCFENMEGRESLITVVKARGAEILKPQASLSPRLSWREKLADYFTPKPLLAAAAAASLCLIVVFGVLPRANTSTPQFFVNDDVVRGDSIQLISPVISVDKAPTLFRWRPLNDDVEYRIYVYNHVLLWQADTLGSSISLPRSVQDRMIEGEEYSWQVKAFSPEGRLVSVSSLVYFKFAPPIQR